MISDLRTGLAGGADERDTWGDGAAAFVWGPEGAVAEILGEPRIATQEFLDLFGGFRARTNSRQRRSASARTSTSHWLTSPSPTPSRTAAMQLREVIIS